MPAHTPLPAQFGRYHILDKVGEGGMGAVYLAEDTQLGRRVALKVPHFTATENPKVIERFYREARVAASIEHPNLCSVHDVGQIDGVHYLTMPFIEGTPLADRMDPDRPWPPRQAAELVRQLAMALAVLHQRGLVHRDLKPTNILLRASGEPVIMDFGLARSFTEDSKRLTATGMALGTPAYMSPEQITGARGQIGPGSDVYSLGVILYELVTGQLPFEGPLAAVYGQILHGAPAAPSALRPGLGNSVDQLCLKALAKKPEDRYPSMAAFAAALQDFLGTGEARPLPPPLPAGKGAPTGSAPRTCPACGKTLQVPLTLQGRQVKCPGCQATLNVSGPRQSTAQQPNPRAASTALRGPAGPTPLGTPGSPPRPDRQLSKLGLVAACLGVSALVGGAVAYLTLRHPGQPDKEPVAVRKDVSAPEDKSPPKDSSAKGGVETHPDKTEPPKKEPETKEPPKKGPGKKEPGRPPVEKPKPPETVPLRETSKRRPPELLAMDEAHAAVVRMQVPTYIVTFDDAGHPDTIKVLVDVPKKTLVADPKGYDPLKALQSVRGGGAILVGGARPMNASRQRLNNLARYRGGRYPGGTGEDAPKEFRAELIPLAKAKNDAHLAVQVRPLRMAIIAGSFPYKKQLEEFRDKLHLGSIDEVLKEPSLEKAKDGTSLPAFRFLGVRAQRVTVDANGKERGPWVEVPLNETYKPFLFLTGKRVERDDPKWQPISFPGLVMPRLPRMHDGYLAATPTRPEPGAIPPPPAPPGGGKEEQYPPVEDAIASLKPVLRQLAARDTPAAVAPMAYRGEDVDIFDPAAHSEKSRPSGKKDDTKPPAATGADADVPSHCLVRVVDLTVEPGKTYKYRLQVRMANPNCKRKDVASPTCARDPELRSDKWFEVPRKVVVPPELVYYAVDQAQLDTDPARVKYWRRYLHNPYSRPINHDRQAVLQAHRWLETVSYQKGEDLLIGEWAVAELVAVSRGEYVGRRISTKFPLWRDTMEDYLIAFRYEKRKKLEGFPVSFGYDWPDRLEPLLVDFENGQTYERPGGRPVRDIMAEEVLMLAPDGKLLGLEGARDAADRQREERLTRVRERIKAIEDKERAKDIKPGFGKP